VKTEAKPRKGKLRLRIERDENARDPRKDDNVGTMVCWHRRYTLGDQQASRRFSQWKIELAVSLLTPKDRARYALPDDDDDILLYQAVQIIDEKAIVLPLYLYDHSGITMATTPFSCPWDSGQVGWIYCTWEKAREEWGPAVTSLQIKKCLQDEVKVYDNYLTGEVYGYIVERWDGDEWVKEDSCLGFYGSDPWTNGIADEMGRRRHRLLRTYLKETSTR
jgi:hypothetical protein